MEKCPKFVAWRNKKGTLLTLVCYEVNLTSLPIHTWWVDSSATTHLSPYKVVFGANRKMMLKDSSMWAMTKQ